MRSFLFLLAAFPLLGAVAMFVAAARVDRAEPELRRTGTAAVGTVVGNREVASEAGRGGFSPVVRFATERGRTVKGTAESVLPRAFPLESAIAVVYDPARPSRFLAGPSRARTYRVGGIVFAGIAVVLAAIGALIG